MCLIALALNHVPGYPLVLIANRDEFHNRPTEGLHQWRQPPILAGRDRVAGGTWLAADKRGRFAALTNFRDGKRSRGSHQSRGELIPAFLASSQSASEWVEQLESRKGQYDGYNLLCFDGQNLVLSSSEHAPEYGLPKGIHTLDNARLNTRWPKSRKLHRAFEMALRTNPDDDDALFGILGDRDRARDPELPDTGVDLEWERLLSSVFIVSNDYGTRSSTILRIHDDASVTIRERQFDPGGERCADQKLAIGGHFSQHSGTTGA